MGEIERAQTTKTKQSFQKFCRGLVLDMCERLGSECQGEGEATFASPRRVGRYQTGSPWIDDGSRDY